MFVLRSCQFTVTLQISSQHEGAGRIVRLKSPIKLDSAIESVKKLLKLKRVRLARANEHTGESLISSIGVCAGSGGSLLAKATSKNIDLFITGEMSHHELLDAIHNSVSVILCEHSNTERGYLSLMRENLAKELPSSVKTLVAELDEDPVVIV